jgi:hypothetical protein
MTKRIAILYIATGKYIIFWKSFFESSEKYFLKDLHYEKNYIVFNDTHNIDYENNPTVHKIFQKSLPWPYITLDRFSIFEKARNILEQMDYIYFFNANMLFVQHVNEEILPSVEKPLVLLKHSGFYNKKRSEFTYDTNKKSLACVQGNEGQYYFMGGLNGGITSEYLKLIDTLKQRVEADKANGTIALWHDESHLNRYAIDHADKIKILEPSYGYPEGWNIPFEPKILIRDKTKYGGHDFLRNEKKSWKEILHRFLK